MKKMLLWLSYLLHFLPLSILHAIAWPIGHLAYYIAKRRRKIGEVNLKLCFPEYSASKRKAILKQNFYHVACMLLEYSLCWYASPKRIRQLVVFENLEIIQQLQAENARLTILYPHFCALELGALRLNLEYPVISVFAKQSDPLLNQKIYAGRTRFKHINPIHLIARNDKIISIIHLLKQSSALFLYLADQDVGKQNSIFVPFFNIETATTTGVSRISKLTRRKVVPIISIRTKQQIVLKVLPVMDHLPSDNIRKDTEKVSLLTEQMVRLYPEQYFWLHRRFKTRPEHENSVY